MAEMAETVIGEARAAIAAGRAPDAANLRARLAGDDVGLRQLERVLAVHRARSRVAPAAAPPPATAPARPAIRTRPTISSNMQVRRDGHARLAWDPAPGVLEWEIRLSERSDARSDYEVRETRTLSASATGAELPLSDRPLRVHVLGRNRAGRLLRRAVISGLTTDSWGERWHQRASAS